MKHIVSISLGSRSRDYRIEIELMGEQLLIERIGVDGDTAEALRLYREYDGRVDCFGIGGATLSISAGRASYELSHVRRLMQAVRQTPYVDGAGFRDVVERQMAQAIEAEIAEAVNPRTALITCAADRLAMALSFEELGYELILGDLAFSLGVPLALHSMAALQRLMAVLGPLFRHMPMRWLYPTGQKEDHTEPRFPAWFARAGVIAGDCNYIRRHMPQDMAGKIIATNTTTELDVRLFRERGVTYLVTSTPRLGTRSFGTNVMEATLVALAGKGRALEPHEVQEMVTLLGWHPNIERLN
jgi:hypothetical protein